MVLHDARRDAGVSPRRGIRRPGYVDFNSDQAIVGLMAKHLSEFRTFPLFYYGQNYMLGVQSWIVAPFFWMARPSIAC